MKKLSRLTAVVASAGLLSIVEPTTLIGNGWWWI